MVGLSVIGMLGYGFYTGDRLISVYAPSVDAAMEIKLEATLAHLWIEEIISGDRRDRQEDIAAVWARLDQADWYASAMLEGGQSPQGTFFPLDDIEAVRRIVKDLRPSVLDVLGILPTISSVIEGFQKKHSDIRIEKEIAVKENEIEGADRTRQRAV
jgi:hypothetical protein